MAEVPGARVEVIGNGVDAPRFAAGSGQRFRHRYALPHGVPVVAVIGRIDAQKGQLDAVRGLAAIPHAHLLLAGPVTSESYAAGLAAEIRELGLEGRVTILPGFDPESQDLVDAYHAADVVMVPSRHEPFGVVVLEAWAAGRPVVATRVGGIPSFVTDGADALLVCQDVLRRAGILKKPEKTCIDAIELWITVGLRNGEKMPIINGCKLAVSIEPAKKKKVHV